MILNKQRCLLMGYGFLSNKEVMEKRGGGAQIFFCEKYGVSTWSKRLLGGYNILLKVVLSDNPHANYQRYAQWGLHYWFMITLQLREGVIQFLNYQIRGSQNIAEVPLEIYEPCTKVWRPLNSFIFVFFDKSNFKKQWFQRNLIWLYIYYFSHIYYCYRDALLRWTR